MQGSTALAASALVLLVLSGAAEAFSPSAALPLRTQRVAASRGAAGVVCAESDTPTRRGLFQGALGLAIGSVLPSAPLPVAAEGGNTAVLKIKTADGIEGEVVIELMPDIAPQTVAQFKQWVESGLYDGTAFHRANKFLDKVVLVGGDPYTKEESVCNNVDTWKGEKTCSNGKGYGPDGFLASGKRSSGDDEKSTRGLWDKGGPPGWRKDGLSLIKLEPEFSGKHERGTISFRRFKKPNSAGSQFVINLADMSKEMDGQSAVFGKITKGIELLDKIDTKNVLKSNAALEFPRDDGKMSTTWSAWDRPVARQGIESIRII